MKYLERAAISLQSVLHKGSTDLEKIGILLANIHTIIDLWIPIGRAVQIMGRERSAPVLRSRAEKLIRDIRREDEDAVREDISVIEDIVYQYTGKRPVGGKEYASRETIQFVDAP